MNEKKGQELMEDLAGGMPCSKRETVENMLEQLCSWRKNSSPLSSSRLCEKFQLSRRECTYYLKKMLECGYIFPLENTDEIRLLLGSPEGRSWDTVMRPLSSFFSWPV